MAAPSSLTVSVVIHEGPRTPFRSSSIYRRVFRPRPCGEDQGACRKAASTRAGEGGSHLCAVRCPVRARVASVWHYTLVAPIRLRGVAAGDGERERNADLLSWDAEDSSSSAWLSLTLFVPAAANLLIDTDACVQDPRSSLSLSRLCPSCVPFRVTTIKTKRYSPTSSLPFTPSPHRPSLPRGSGQFHSVPSTLFPKLCDRALPATGYRGPGRRAYAHSEPCSRERAGCGWTGWGHIGRREEAWLSGTPA
jgi:hypothetical protein